MGGTFKKTTPAAAASCEVSAGDELDSGFMFAVGREVRVMRKCTADGGIPRFWSSSRSVIVSRRAMLKIGKRIYRLYHITRGVTGLFSEQDLDMRFRPCADRPVASAVDESCCGATQ